MAPTGTGTIYCNKKPNRLTRILKFKYEVLYIAMLLLSDLDLRLARSFSLDKNEHRDFLLNNQKISCDFIEQRL